MMLKAILNIFHKYHCVQIKNELYLTSSNALAYTYL